MAFPSCRRRHSPHPPRRRVDRGIARNDIVALSALGLSVLILAVPTVWVSRARMSAVSTLSAVMPPSRERTPPGDVSPEVRRLQLEVVRLEDVRRTLEEQLAQATEFARSARSVGLDLGRFVECSVIGHSVNWQEGSFLVDRGSRHGVVTRAGCVVGGAAVGVVVEVGETVSRVSMLTEPGVRVAGRTLETRRSGLVVGSGASCELSHVPRWSPSHERPRAGETVVTSGRLGFFPPGFLIGRVAQVGEIPESLHLSIAVVPDVVEPPQGRVWVLKPLPDRVDDGEANR